MRVGGKYDIDGVHGCMEEESKRACSELARGSEAPPGVSGGGGEEALRYGG